MYFLFQDKTLSRIKEAEESAKKKLVQAEEEKVKIIEEARTKSINLIFEADNKDNEFREKEIIKAREKISKLKQKLIQENNSLVESMKKNAGKKLKSQQDFVVKKFSEEVFS